MIPGISSMIRGINSGPTLTKIGTYSSITDSSGGSYTVTIDLGPPSPDRLVVVDVTMAIEGTGSLTGATLGGVAMTTVVADNFRNTDRGAGAMFSRVVPSGTSASLVLEHTGSPTYSYVADVFTIVGLSANTAYSTGKANGSSTSLSTTINVADNGIIIAGGGGWRTSTPYTWTGVTKVTELNSGDGGAALSSATAEDLPQQNNRTISWSTPGTGRNILVVASWR